MSLNSINITRVAQQASSLVRVRFFCCQSKVTHCPQSVRTVCSFRRLHPPKKQGADIPLLERYPLSQKYYIYSLEDNTMNRPQGNITVILKYDIEGLGMKGDVLSVEKRLARSTLLPAGVAMYASPENLAANEEERQRAAKRKRKSIWAQKTVRLLEGMHLPIGMSPLHPWTLKKTHVRVAFRHVGVEMDEECIELPEAPVNEFGPITFHVTVNKEDRVPVSGTVYQWTTDERYRPTQEVWGHSKITIPDAVIEVMKKNGLIENENVTL